jgi:DNA polymerase III alpha subunit (gram-positive type)
MGGTNPKTSLLTLYGMVLDPKLQIIDTIDLKIKPNNGIYHVTAKAMEVNQIDIIKHDAEALPLQQAAKLFETFACNHSIGFDKMIPTGHNLSLDIRFCKRYFLKTSENAEGNYWNRFFSHRRLDTATMAHALILAGKLPSTLECSLGSLANHFGYDYEGAHDAEFDAKLTLKILEQLIKLMS